MGSLNYNGTPENWRERESDSLSPLRKVTVFKMLWIPITMTFDTQELWRYNSAIYQNFAKCFDKFSKLYLATELNNSL